MEIEDAVLMNDQVLKQQNRQVHSLIRQFEEWKMRSPASGDQPDAKRIQALVENFIDFFTVFYLYFVRRVGAGDFAEKRPSEVLHSVTRRILDQGTTITRLLGQRRYGSLYRNYLLEADQKAKAYYDRYHGLKLGGNEPLAYFEKVYHIIHFPFRPPPLVAIPFSDWNRPKDWLPLAHELGHHVFWNSADLPRYRQIIEEFRNAVTEGLAESLKAIPAAQAEPVRLRWLNCLEECFADLFGVLVAGPAYAREAQERLLRESVAQPTDLLIDDSEHPMPAIRPLIASETLKYMPDGMAVAEVLEERWAPYVAQAEALYQKNLKKAPPQRKAAPNPPSPRLMADTVQTVMKVLLNHLVLLRDTDGLKKESLLNLVEPWQPEPGELNMAKFANELPKKLPPLPLPQVQSADRESRISPEEETYRSTFQKLKEFVRQEIEQDAEERAEWEVLLDMGLVSQADHSSCQYHSEYLWHYHDYWNRVRCC